MEGSWVPVRRLVLTASRTFLDLVVNVGFAQLEKVKTEQNGIGKVLKLFQ